MNPSTTPEHLFNTPVESGLRSLFLLNAVKPQACDLQRLVIYDYLLVHSDDVTDGPKALHPATPLRSGELLVRRTLVEQGLQLLIRKGLATKSYTKDGIQYTAPPIAELFLAYLKSAYAQRCVEISKWIAGRFQPLSDDELREFIHQNLGRWGTEFTKESVLWEDVE
ncbi:MAG: ABC-three component system middle component 2 [Gemmataceae bacterium]